MASESLHETAVRLERNVKSVTGTCAKAVATYNTTTPPQLVGAVSVPSVVTTTTTTPQSTRTEQAQ
jgi:hypothetical protein